jgi:hypothetical protein
MEYFRGKELEFSELLNVEVLKNIITVDHKGRVVLDLYLQVWSTLEEKCVGMFETLERRSPEVNQGRQNPRGHTMSDREL